MELGHEPLVFNSQTKTVASIVAGYDASIVVRRWAATWIDLIVLAGCLLIPEAVLGNETYQRTLYVWLGLMLLYIPAMELAFGKTLGKFALFIRVVDANGDKPSIVQVIGRTFFRLIEVNPLLMGGIPAGLIVYFSKHRQRLGDMVANTYVLRDADLRDVRKATIV